MNITIEGTVLEVHEVRKVSDKFSLREFKIITDDDYPQTYRIGTIGKNMNQLDSVNVGDKVSAKCNLKGRDNGDRNYISVEAWSISVKSKGNGKVASKKVEVKADEDGVLPF